MKTVSPRVEMVAAPRMVGTKREGLWRRDLFLLMLASKAVVLFEFGIVPVVGRRVTGRTGIMLVAIVEEIEMQRVEEVGR